MGYLSFLLVLLNLAMSAQVHADPYICSLTVERVAMVEGTVFRNEFPEVNVSVAVDLPLFSSKAEASQNMVNVFDIMSNRFPERLNVPLSIRPPGFLLAKRYMIGQLSMMELGLFRLNRFSQEERIEGPSVGVSAIAAPIEAVEDGRPIVLSFVYAEGPSWRLDASLVCQRTP